MEDLRHWTEILLASYKQLVEGFISVFPKIIVGIILFTLGWFVARLISRLFAKSLRLLRFDRLMDQAQIGGFVRRMKMSKKPSDIIGKFIFWTLILLMVVGFADVMGLRVVSQKIGALINYIPNIIIALLVLIFGLFLAGKVKEVVELTFTSYAVKAGKLVGNIIFYLLAIVICLTALDQLKFDIHLLTSNVMILIGGVALAFAIAYGLSAKEILPNLISSYYSKNLFSVGQTIQLGETQGEILEINNTSVIIKTASGRRIIPAKKLVTEEVEIIEKHSDPTP